MTSAAHIIPAAVIMMISLLMSGITARSLGYRVLPFTATIAGVTFDLSVAENGTNVTLPDGAACVHSEIDVYIEVPPPAPQPSSIRIENILGTTIYGEYTCNHSRMCETQVKVVKAQAKEMRAEIRTIVDFDLPNLQQIHINGAILLEGNKWFATPGNISVLENTDATFNWTFTVLGPINIAWFYWGTPEHRTLKYILGFDLDGQFIPRSNWSSRVEYVNFPGSAVMIIRNVTSAEGGLYEAKVADVAEIFLPYVPHISDTVTLSIVSGSDLEYIVTIADVTFDLCVAENGTDVTLPDVTVISPKTFDVRVQFASTSPRPSGIRINNPLYNTSCEQSHTCNIHIDIEGNRETSQQVDLVITIHYDIWNLPPIHIVGSVAPVTIKSQTSSSTIGLVTGISAGIVIGIVVVVVALVFVFLRKISKSREKGMGKTRTRIRTTDPDWWVKPGLGPGLPDPDWWVKPGPGPEATICPKFIMQ